MVSVGCMGSRTWYGVARVAGVVSFPVAIPWYFMEAV